MRICCVLFFSLLLLLTVILMTQHEATDWLIVQSDWLVEQVHKYTNDAKEHDHEGEAAHDDHDDHDDESDTEEHDHEAKEEHDEHEDDHDDHKDEDDHDETKLTLLSAAQMQALNIEVSQAKSGQLRRYITLTGEIALNEDNVVHLVPRVEGIVLKVNKKLGNRVKKGEVMAVLESREMADAIAEYLASKEQLALAQDNYDRKSQLLKKRLISELQLFEIKQALLDTQIKNQSAARKLHALGFSNAEVKNLPQQPVSHLTKYQMFASINGVVVEKHIVLGEILSPDVSEFAIAEGTILSNESSAYVIADLSSVWVNFDVYPRDLLHIKKNQAVTISSNDGIAKTRGKISYISPMIDKETRTALIRCVLPNPKRQWRAGLFVAGKILIETINAKVVVPKTALQNDNTLFIVTEDSYVLQPIKLGRSDESHIEILAGLEKGQTYVSHGSFILRAEMQKSIFAEAGHSH
jgi:cobalt-zinc-cadmium efflux system membrane fusion protein